MFLSWCFWDWDEYVRFCHSKGQSSRLRWKQHFDGIQHLTSRIVLEFLVVQHCVIWCTPLHPQSAWTSDKQSSNLWGESVGLIKVNKLDVICASVVICCVVLQIVFVGMLIGSNVWGAFSDKYGRRPVSESVISAGTVVNLKMNLCCVLNIINCVFVDVCK